jgi:ribosomal peptide maturation radical SAM protein 1
MDGPLNAVFAVMPFADPSMPTLGVSLLKAACTRDGVPSRVRYFNIDFVDRIGVDLYRRIANSFPPESLVGEWFFADLVFGDAIPHEEDYFTNILSRYPDYSELMPQIRKARREARKFIDWCAAEIASMRPSIVGFPTTFHQTCACLALAKKLKESPASPIIIFGGANCEGEMGHQMLQSFPWLDYVCTQEGDIAFPELLRQLRRVAAPQVPGIASRHDSGGATPPLVEQMDSLPVPDFGDYFERIVEADWAAGIDVHLLLETSRGCWWGAKQHCTFCGLNGATMAYRSKTPERAFDEICELVTRYGVKRVECVDNILDNRYISTVFPKLAESGLGIDLFYEVKANLRLDQLQAMRAGGMTSIQPGIESLSTRVLQVMQKGVTAAQNIQLLRWCGEVGINVAWNLLGGFPREPMEEYDRQAAIIPLLVHLQPPASCGKFRLDRFSPHFTRPESLGIERIRPMAAYFYVYPLTRRGLMRLAYYFDFDHADGREPDTYIGSAGSEVHKWWACRTNPAVDAPVLDAFENASGEFLIHDTRPCRVAPEHELKELSGALYALCDTAHSLASLVKTTGTPAAELEPVLQDLVRRKLMLEVDGQFLSLAVFRRRAQKPISRNNHDWIQIAAPQAAEPLPAAL